MANNVNPLAGIYFTVQNNPAPVWLPLISLSSITALHDTAARTSLTQTFLNPSSVSPIPSAKYTFPLYQSCAVVAFRCTIGTTIIHGVVKEKEDATAGFRAAVGRQEPASLLEQHTPDVFSTSIGRIAPAQTVTVEIEYIMELAHDAEIDGLRFTIPTSVAPRYGAPPTAYSPLPGANLTGIDIAVKLTMSSNILSVQVCLSPHHHPKRLF